MFIIRNFFICAHAVVVVGSKCVLIKKGYFISLKSRVKTKPCIVFVFLIFNYLKIEIAYKQLEYLTKMLCILNRGSPNFFLRDILNNDDDTKNKQLKYFHFNLSYSYTLALMSNKLFDNMKCVDNCVIIF